MRWVRTAGGLIDEADSQKGCRRREEDLAVALEDRQVAVVESAQRA
jgi:hypothetical protein